MDGTESARPETWVRIHLVFLPHGQRGPGVPTDTAAQPYEGWINGWVQQWAAGGGEGTIRTLAGRRGGGGAAGGGAGAAPGGAGGGGGGGWGGRGAGGRRRAGGGGGGGPAE